MSNIIYEYSEVENKELKKYIVDTSRLHNYFKLDWKVLKTQQYCGILNYDNKDYYLLPKIANKNDKTNLDIFIYMLMYAYGLMMPLGLR